MNGCRLRVCGEYFERRNLGEETEGTEPSILASDSASPLWLSRIFFPPPVSRSVFAVSSARSPSSTLSSPSRATHFSAFLSQFFSTASFPTRFSFLLSPFLYSPLLPFPLFLPVSPFRLASFRRLVVFPAPFRWKIGQPYTCIRQLPVVLSLSLLRRVVLLERQKRSLSLSLSFPPVAL